MASSNKAELAELFSLLKSAGSTKPAASTTDTPMEMHTDAKNKRLSQPPQPREVEKRPRRNTVASILAQQDPNVPFDATMADASEDTTDRESLADFARADAKKYAFAFKLPIYKLYKKADWARTVRETLEQSKDRFKPLAEQSKDRFKPLAEQVVYAGAKENAPHVAPAGKDAGAVRFAVPAAPPPSGGRARRGSVAATRQRSASSAGAASPGVARGAQSPPAQRTVFPRSPAVHERPEVRALKKRCVGRRKSATELQGADAGKARSNWVYNAAVSASERPAAATFASFPPAPPASPTGAAGSRYGPMLGVKNTPSVMQGAAGHKRRVSDGGPAMMTPYKMTPLGQGGKGLVSGRRAMALDLEDEGCEAIERQQFKHAFD